MCHSKLFFLLFLTVFVCNVVGQQPHVKCEVKHKKIGCFAEVRADLLFTDRDFYDKNNKGHVVDWYNWNEYIVSLACRCNDEAKKKGLNYFLLRWFAVCYGSKDKPNGARVENRNCVGPDYQRCVDSANTECVGVAGIDYVYEVGRDGGFSDWRNSTACSKSCGGGTKTLTRSCNNPLPSGYGKNCSHLGADTQVVACNDKSCSVNGGFSEWSEFGNCTRECGGGNMTRFRKCDNPLPAHGGSDCIGPKSETKSCNTKPCPVNGGFSEWSEFGNCTRECGGGNMTRFRKCDNPSPAHGGLDCIGPKSETKSCNTKPCPVNGGFSEWSEFGNCTRKCGGGNMTRYRKCDNPSPAHGGLDCIGPKRETKSCNTKPCPVNGGFSEWSEFGNCTRECGGGNMTRFRKCDNPLPAHGGLDCIGPKRETKSCNIQPCPVDGGLSSWTEFGSCSRTCGEGITTRKRFCNRPKPAHGGKNCSGHLIDRKSCMLSLCAGPDGGSEAAEVVTKFLLNFHKSTFPLKEPSGKFFKAVNAIKKATLDEFASASSGVSLEKRLNDLRKFLKVATEGGSIDFARTTLGKSLFVFMKKKVEEGLSFEEIEKGAKGFLESIKKDIGSEKYGEIMLEKGDATLMFAIDTSASMTDEIESAKAIASSIINTKRDFPVDYILSPFSDPEHGPVTHKNSTFKKGFINAIQSLKITGGSDCPELAFTGMLGALNAGPRLGSPMFVFTDASAKDDSFENMQELKATADRLSSTISFFSNKYGCGDPKGIKSFSDIASHTSGQVFPLVTSAELDKFKDYVKNSLAGGTVIANGGFSVFGRRIRRSFAEKRFLIDIDSEVSSLILTLNVNQRGTANLVKLTDASGKVQTEQTMTSFSKVYNIKDPAPGQWILEFAVRNGQGFFSAKATQKNHIEVSYHFLHQEKDGESPVLRMSNPLKGKPATLIIQISNIDLLKEESLTVDLINEFGRPVLSSLRLRSVDGAAGTFKATISPPLGKFKVAVRGTTQKGDKFQRVSQNEAEAQNAVMAVMSAGEEFAVSLSKGFANVKVYVYNQGNTANFNFRASAGHGIITADTSNLSIEKASNATVGFRYQLSASAASLVGKTDVLRITAVGEGSSKTQISFSVLLIK